MALDRHRARVGQPLVDECRLADDRLAEVGTLLLDAAAPTLTTWEAGRLLAAAAGTLSAVEARLHRHGACRAAAVAELRGRIAAARGTSRQTALAPVLDALRQHDGIVAGIPARQAMDDLAAARVALARAQAEAGDADTDGELRRLQRLLEDAYGAWGREQQRRYDLWALERARALDGWARSNLSDIPLRGAGTPEVEARMLEGWVRSRCACWGRPSRPCMATCSNACGSNSARTRIRVVAQLVAAPKRQPGEM